jgi:hypothetical protein
MFSSNTTQVDGGYQISRSLRFNSADSAYLNRTPASAGNRTTWTWSGWAKVCDVSNYGLFCIDSNNRFLISSGNLFFDYQTAGTYRLVSSAVYRDPSAWYHIVLAVDTTQATASNRIKIYVNGSQVTDFSTANYPTQNLQSSFNNTVQHNIGAENARYYFNGYMTEVYLIDGQALTPSSFGETNAQTGVWQPKAYSGSYGTNGFYLNFSDNSNTTSTTLGKDYSGNGNNWTPNNFSVSAGAGNDSLVDTPTPYGLADTGAGGEVRGNYATWNPLKRFNYNVTLANGNLDTSVTQTASTEVAVANMALPTTGKWYWEVTLQTYTNASADVFLGVCTIANATQNTASTVTSGGGYYRGDGAIRNLSNSAQTSGGTWSQGDIIGIAVDVGAGTVQFYKNNVAQGATPSFSFTAGTELVPYIANDNSANAKVTNLNFGQRPFAYTAPSGYKALCTQNLPTPTIGATSTTQADRFFTPNLWSGNGGAQTITNNIDTTNGGGLIWFKGRNLVVNNFVINSNSGYTKFLASNTTAAEDTFDFGFTPSTTGFSFNSGSGSVNQSGYTYVAWQWKAGGTGVTNTAGSITSTVSANTTAGFSVVTWTGNGSSATIGHGLGVAPSMIITKFRGDISNWSVYHISTGALGRLKLNSADAFATNAGSWNDTAPTSTVFSKGSGENDNGITQVAYCFAPIAGYSAFGSYTGNGSSDGPFVFTGFRPAFILIKGSSDSDRAWVMLDVKRNTYNVMNLNLYANASDAEATDTRADATSNGFKLRGTGTWVNNSGSTYIYAAFAEFPFKYALAR